MEKSKFKYLALGIGGLMAFAPLAGNAYYCSAPTGAERLYALAAMQDASVLETLNIKAKSCVVMEKSSGQILLEKNKDDSYPMASMTKMMTLLLVMDEVEKGVIDLHQTTTISEFAASQEGSECFLDAGGEYTVKELIKSVVVASANDSTVALAELVAGSEEMFARKMNERAASIGLSRTHFINSTGLDAKGHVSSAEDMCKLMRELSKHEVALSEFARVWTYDMQHSGDRVTNLTNTNRLVKTNPDLTLAKTGHTDGAGYCITALGVRDGMELVVCVMGEADSKARFEDATKLLNFGFTNYMVNRLASVENSVGSIKVKGGKVDEISVYPSQDISVLEAKDENLSVQKIISIDEQISAPKMSGAKVGEVVFRVGDKEYSTDLIIKDAVEESTYKDIIHDLLEEEISK